MTGSDATCLVRHLVTTVGFGADAAAATVAAPESAACARTVPQVAARWAVMTPQARPAATATAPLAVVAMPRFIWLLLTLMGSSCADRR